jgi:hypothetical protein
MELFENIRLKIGNAILKNKMAHTKRKTRYSNMSQVKNIGIVWDASKTDDFASLSRFYQKMHESKIEVKILGYYAGKNLPDQYTAIRYLRCIRKNELNAFYHPVSSETNTFIYNHFDILIDINFKRLLPLQYISSLSIAGFKVGLFDLMMELKSPVNIDNYLNQVIHYLEMIKSEEVKKVAKK